MESRQHYLQCFTTAKLESHFTCFDLQDEKAKLSINAADWHTLYQTPRSVDTPLGGSVTHRPYQLAKTKKDYNPNSTGHRLLYGRRTWPRERWHLRSETKKARSGVMS